MLFEKYGNILALLKLPLAFIKGHIVIHGDTYEHGDVFFYIMPSKMGPQRAASNWCTRTKALEDNDELLVHMV